MKTYTFAIVGFKFKAFFADRNKINTFSKTHNENILFYRIQFIECFPDFLIILKVKKMCLTCKRFVH